jgi:hypothetical protein
MENNEVMCRDLMKENEALRSALTLSLNTSLVKRLKDALDRINSGEYVSEEEFFKH